MLKLDLESTLGGFELRVTAELGPRSAILGPSGAGKTSLLEVVAGLRDARGTIELEDRVLLDTDRGVALSPEERRIGYVPQDGALFPHLSVRENLEFARREGQRVVRSSDLEEIVDLLEIEGLLSRAPRWLSGGERRRVALGRALLAQPELLLLDEPTAGLDPERAARALGSILRVRRQREVPLLVVTHDEGEALALADEVLRLEAGREVACGPAREVLAHADFLAARGGRPLANVAAGTVRAHDATGGVTFVLLEGGPEVTVAPQPELAVGSAITLAVDAGSLLVATEPPRGLSARNVVEGRLDELIEAGSSVYARLGDWLAHLTPTAVASLGLEPGRQVWLVVKTHSWRILAD